MKKIKVYATCFWQDDKALFENLKQYGFGKAAWKNIEFTLKGYFDRVAIFTSPHTNHAPYKRENAITFLTEPSASQHHVLHETSRVSPMYLPLSFWISSSKENKEMIIQAKFKKHKILSAVTSELYALDGHKRRLQFIYYLDKKIGKGFDLFGRRYTGEFFNLINAYRGEIADKFDALIGYEYHLACENSFTRNYFTEKIVDPIISETLCFYDGCVNINEFIDERAFIKIDVNNIERSMDTIIQAINDANEYTKRIKYIKEQKERLLYDLNPLNIIWLELNEMDVMKYLRI